MKLPRFFWELALIVVHEVAAWVVDEVGRASKRPKSKKEAHT
jgi:hypothetical protein